MKLKIKITKEILKQSEMCGISIPHPYKSFGQVKEYTSNCAISLAIRELFPRASVNMGSIFINKGLIINLPLEAIDFIESFDSLMDNPEKRLNLPEMEFQVDLPEPVIDYINIDSLRKILDSSETLELVHI